MVTILPIDVDEDFVRDALTAAAGDRLVEAAKNLADIANNLSANGIIDRADFQQAFDRIYMLQASLIPVLDYAKAFNDQWPVEDDHAGEGDSDVR